MPRMTKLIALLMASGVAATAACGGGGSDAAANTAEKREQAMLAFAECMRSHGVDVPDPTTDSNGNLMIRGPQRISRENPGDDSKERTAQRACRKHLEATAQSFTPEQRAEMQDRMVKFAECMRGKGIDMPDPDFSPAQGGIGFRQRIRDSGVNPEDSKFRTASSECSKQVFGGHGGPGRGIFLAPAPGGNR